VKALIERIEGKRGEVAQEIILQPELIIRKTCGFHVKGYTLKGVGKGFDSNALDHLPQ
jgi:hypothetical protein